MFQLLRSFGDAYRLADGPAEERADPADRRLDHRYDFTGRQVRVRAHGSSARIHLKDISCYGISCLSEVPLARGEMILVELGALRLVAAEVRWVRNALAGLRFANPLEPQFLLSLHEGDFGKDPQPSPRRRR